MTDISIAAREPNKITSIGPTNQKIAILQDGSRPSEITFLDVFKLTRCKTVPSKAAQPQNKESGPLIYLFWRISVLRRPC